MISMPTIIVVIAPTFSARNGASSGGAEWNAAEQIAVMYSARDGTSAGSAAKAIAVAMRPAAAATELRQNRERMKSSIAAPCWRARAAWETVPAHRRRSGFW